MLFWGSGVVIPLKDEEGKLMGFTKIMRDITARKKLEQRKDDFLSIASHELKTPITSIKGYAQILKKRLGENKDAKNSYFIRNIDYQTDKLVSLINDFLDISKIEAGKLVFSRKAFNLGKLIKRIITDFQYTTENHKIINIGNVNKTIKGDPDRISQILINLITNAIKFSPEGKDIIVRSGVSKDYATVSVQDFGIGIPKPKQKHIFDKYFQVSEDSTTTKQGFGLGLYITSEIVKRHGGAIWVESKRGKGSTFSFTLPLN